VCDFGNKGMTWNIVLYCTAFASNCENARHFAMLNLRRRETGMTV
jgi:hypothetical protein